MMDPRKEPAHNNNNQPNHYNLHGDVKESTIHSAPPPHRAASNIIPVDNVGEMRSLSNW